MKLNELSDQSFLLEEITLFFLGFRLVVDHFLLRTVLI